MVDIPSWLDDIRALHCDPLRVARAVAASGQPGSGQRVVAYAGCDVPVELILAAQAFPVRLCGIAEATPLADRYLESAFTPEARSICEQWLRGDLNFIDAVIFPRSDDAMQRLYYYLCELQRSYRTQGPTPLLFDVATITRATSVDNTLTATQRLAGELRTDDTALRNSVTRYQMRMEILERLCAMRVAPQALRGSDAFLLSRTAGLDWREKFDTNLVRYLDNAEGFSSRARVLFAGNTPPDHRFHLAVEQASGNIVCELTEHRHAVSKIGADVIADIAHRHHRGATISQQMRALPTLLVDVAREVNAQGVVLWAIEEDGALPWEIARQVNALHSAGMPTLSLTRQAWQADQDTLAQVSTFVASLSKSG